jgi:hypothetical protein
MLLGVLGPAAILLHANFAVDSVNGGVALVSMLLVSLSGFVGRFFYTRVHHGLFGHRETLREVGLRAESSRSALAQALRGHPAAVESVRSFEARALARPRGPLDALSRLLLFRGRARATQRRVRRLLRAAAPSAAAVPESLEQALRVHLDTVRRVAQFGVYERALSLWHAVHVPLCVVLFSAAAVHVVAVHLY